MPERNFLFLQGSSSCRWTGVSGYGVSLFFDYLKFCHFLARYRSGLLRNQFYKPR